jgi:hypothetical protein
MHNIRERLFQFCTESIIWSRIKWQYRLCKCIYIVYKHTLTIELVIYLNNLYNEKLFYTIIKIHIDLSTLTCTSLFIKCSDDVIVRRFFYPANTHCSFSK